MDDEYVPKFEYVGLNRLSIGAFVVAGFSGTFGAVLGLKGLYVEATICLLVGAILACMGRLWMYRMVSP